MMRVGNTTKTSIWRVESDLLSHPLYIECRGGEKRAKAAATMTILKLGVVDTLVDMGYDVADLDWYAVQVEEIPEGYE